MSSVNRVFREIHIRSPRSFHSLWHPGLLVVFTIWSWKSATQWWRELAERRSKERLMRAHGTVTCLCPWPYSPLRPLRRRLLRRDPTCWLPHCAVLIRCSAVACREKRTWGTYTRARRVSYGSYRTGSRTVHVRAMPVFARCPALIKIKPATK